MNYTKKIKEIDDQIAELYSVKTELEKILIEYAHSESYASINVATSITVMLKNIGVGIALLGANNGSKDFDSIEDAEKLLKNTNDKIIELDSQRRRLKIEKDETVQEAELEVVEDCIFVKGDSTRTDILSGIKQARSNDEKALKETLKIPALRLYFSLLKQLDEIKDQYAIPSDLIKDISKQFPGTHNYLYIKINDDYYAYREDFVSEVIESIKKEKQSLSKSIEERKMHVLSIEPTLIEKLFAKSRYAKRVEELKKSNSLYNNEDMDKIEKLSEMERKLLKIEQEIIKPYFEKQLEQIPYQFNQLDEKVISRLLEKCEKLKNRLEEGKSYRGDELYGMDSMIPEKVQEFLDENNYEISLWNIYEKVCEMGDSATELKQEMLNAYPVLEEKRKITNSNKSR